MKMNFLVIYTRSSSQLMLTEKIKCIKFVPEGKASIHKNIISRDREYTRKTTTTKKGKTEFEITEINKSWTIEKRNY